MKTLSLALALLAGLSAPVLAQSTAQDDYCSALADVAAGTMELRQMGAPLALGLEMAQTAHPMIRPQALQLVGRAWQSDIVAPEQKYAAASVFAGRAYVGCMRTQF